MESLTEKIFEQALDLPIEDRLDLIDKLLISSNLVSRKEIDDAWAQEVENRFSDLENNKTKLIEGKEVFEKIHLRYSK